MMVRSRKVSFLILLFVYIGAFALGTAIYHVTGGTPLWRMFAADLAATVFVWLFGLVFRNASVYDPYWSAAPLCVIPAWMLQRGGVTGLADVLLLTAVYAWGIRLTINWAVRFKGLRFEDWRYTMYRRKAPRLWPLVNLFGIHLMPTVLVFGGMLPAYFGILHNKSPDGFTFAGFVLCVASAGMQLVSDGQMTRHMRSGAKGCIQTGLWRYSRHPNYLGEVLFWWGVCVMQAGVLPMYWYAVIGPVAITLLFVFVSIPMMERHMLDKRPSYEDYQKSVPLVPWFNRPV